MLHPIYRHGLLCCAWIAIQQVACMNLDRFFFNPEPVSADTDLISRLVGVPEHLRTELPLLPTADGGQIQTWMVRHEANDGTNPNHHNTFILYCHGNAKHLGHYAPRIAHLWQLGYSVFALDYRGYGKSPGTPSEQHLYLDGQAAWLYLQGELQQMGAETKVLVYGYSLGGVVATYLATTYQLSHLALEATFSNVDQLIDDSATFNMSESWFVESNMNNLSRLITYKGKLLLMHGEQDTFIRPEHSRRLHQAALQTQYNQLVLVPNARHDTVPCLEPASASPLARDCPQGLASYYQEQLAALW